MAILRTPKDKPEIFEALLEKSYIFLSKRKKVKSSTFKNVWNIGVVLPCPAPDEVE